MPSWALAISISSACIAFEPRGTAQNTYEGDEGTEVAWDASSFNRHRVAEPRQLALEFLAHRIRKNLGGFLVELGNCDALVFTGGMPAAKSQQPRSP